MSVENKVYHDLKHLGIMCSFMGWRLQVFANVLNSYKLYATAVRYQPVYTFPFFLVSVLEHHFLFLLFFKIFFFLCKLCTGVFGSLLNYFCSLLVFYLYIVELFILFYSSKSLLMWSTCVCVDNDYKSKVLSCTLLGFILSWTLFTD